MSCFTCNGPKPKDCLSCPPKNNLPQGAKEFKLTDGVCKVTCVNEKYYHHLDREECIQCHFSCLKCKGPTENDCLPYNCIEFYSWNEAYELCTPVCGLNKYYEPFIKECTGCPVLEQCSVCGPSRNQCLDAVYCNEGFEWDEINPFTCKIKLTLAKLVDLGLNPNKQYFQLLEEIQEEQDESEVTGDLGSYNENDVVLFPEEKTLIFENSVKIECESDNCGISYKDPLTKNIIPLNKEKGQELTLPADVEIIIEKETSIIFQEKAKTLERKVEAGTEEVKPTSGAQNLYQKDDIVEFKNEKTEVVFKYETVFEFKYDSSLIHGIKTTAKPGQKFTFDKSASIKFLNEPEMGDILSNSVKYEKIGEKDIDLTVVKANS